VRRAWRAALALCLLATQPAGSSEPATGDVLAEVSLDECGEITLVGSKLGYRPWRAGGEPQLIHFMAGRPSLAAHNAPVMGDVLRDRPAILPFAMTVVDLDDAIWGTRPLVKAGIEYNKRKRPRVRVVVDCVGALAKRWKLPAASSALILLDADRRVRFARVGPTTEAERLRLLGEIDKLGLCDQGARADGAAGAR
jgi:YtfJ family uncharacterized protein